ncbi:MAG: PDZ domain-containing protein [Planctomycetota bacterium]|nr:MAG: PDZ domain-containing protein [Planctomycetota bacterium]
MLWLFVVIISIFALSLPFALVLAFIFGKDILFKDNGDSDNIKYGSARPIVARGNLAEDEKSTIELYNQSRQGVVNITTLANRKTGINLNIQQMPEGTGSGFVWDDAGHIVTNFHVIQNADAAQITFADQSVFQARLVGYFADKDLAVLKVDAPKGKLKPLPLGRSDDLQVGQKVYAIGNPFGLDQTLTTGIISALGREIDSVNKRPIKNVIQSDAAINPGNSGGPLLDSAGLLIGVNTAIYSTSGVSAGIGFAIPVDEVNRVVPELIKHGKVTKPGLGVTLAPDNMSRQWVPEGVVVLDVLPEGAAAKVGIRGSSRKKTGNIVLGDIIKSVDGKQIKVLKDLYLVLDQKKVGDVVKVLILREEVEMGFDITLMPLQSLKP